MLTRLRHTARSSGVCSPVLALRRGSSQNDLELYNTLVVALHIWHTEDALVVEANGSISAHLRWCCCISWPGTIPRRYAYEVSPFVVLRRFELIGVECRTNTELTQTFGCFRCKVPWCRRPLSVLRYFDIRCMSTTMGLSDATASSLLVLLSVMSAFSHLLRR